MKGRRKKLTALFLCLVFIAALTACAGKNEGAAYSEEPVVQSGVETLYSETSETSDRQAASLSGENKVDCSIAPYLLLSIPFLLIFQSILISLSIPVYYVL